MNIRSKIFGGGNAAEEPVVVKAKKPKGAKAETLNSIPVIREALVSLDNDRAFLTRGDVFSDDQIDAYMELKWEEVMRWETTPSPVEFDMYYSS